MIHIVGAADGLRKWKRRFHEPPQLAHISERKVRLERERQQPGSGGRSQDVLLIKYPYGTFYP